MNTHKKFIHKGKQRRSYKRTGLVLVLVLWVTVIVAVLALALAQNTRLDNAVRMAVSDRVTARWLARAGVYRALSEIAEDYNGTDYSWDNWYDNEEIFRSYSMPGGSFSVYTDRFEDNDTCAWGVGDEASKLNLNTATRAALLSLGDMNATLADAIIDWRDNLEQMQGEFAREDISPEEPFPINFGQKVIDSVRQLALVQGMTEKLLYGEDANYNGILESNENDGDATAPADNQDGILDRGLLSYVTVYSFEYNRDGQGRKRININTVNMETMLNQLGLNICQANWILQNRKTGFTSIVDLLDDTSSLAEGTIECTEKDQIIPIDVNTFQQIADRITVRDEEIIPGRININTAGKVVLQTLPGINKPLAERIIQYQQDLPEGFTNIAELLEAPGITINLFKKLADMITVRSNVFTIRSCGQTQRSGLTHSIEAVAVRGISGPSVIYWQESR